MPNKGNNKIDYIIARSIENYAEIPFNESAWEKMEAMLEKEERKPLLLWWRWAAGLFFLLLVGAAGMYFFNNQKNQAVHLEKQEKNKSELQKAPITDSESEKIANPKSIEDQETTKESSQKGVSSKKGKNINSPSKISNPNFAVNKGATINMDISSKVDFNYQKKEEIQESMRSNGAIPKTPDQSQVFLDFSNENRERVEKSEDPIVAISDEAKQFISMLPSLGLLPLENPLFPEALDSNRMKPQISPITKQAKTPKRLKFGIITAAEVNAVGRDGFTRLGLKIGFDLQYRMGEKWNVGTGLAYNLKPYVAYGDEFELPFPWPHGLPATETIGLCDMLEIPILARYHKNGVNNSGLFYGASSVSYVIFQQGYEYIYPTNSYSDLIHYYSTTKNRYYFAGVMEASVGYQFVGKNIPNLQVMPYLQIPFVPVGSGNTKLYSFGLSFRCSP